MTDLLVEVVVDGKDGDFPPVEVGTDNPLAATLQLSAKPLLYTPPTCNSSLLLRSMHMFLAPPSVDSVETTTVYLNLGSKILPTVIQLFLTIPPCLMA